MKHLTLRAVDFLDPMHWRWTLSDIHGAFLGDHQVSLTPSPQYYAFLDLYGHLWRNCAPDRRLQDETRILTQLGQWAGAELLGPPAPKLIQETPASIHVIVPESTPEAEPLLYLPWELAHANGKPLAHHDVSLVLRVEGDARRTDLQPAGRSLRGLAVFSLPEGESALNLRREALPAYSPAP